MTIFDQWTKKEIEQFAQESTSMHEFIKKLGYKSDCQKNQIKNKCQQLGINLDHFTGLSHEKIKRTKENIFVENSDASQTTLREWFKKETSVKYECAICGQKPIWNNKPLTLTLDHINGINNDNRIENLRWVCPNCDRQLDTFGSKNPIRKHSLKPKTINHCISCGAIISDQAHQCIKCYGKSIRQVERPDADTLQKLLLTNKGNFTQVGKIFNVSDNTIRKWCKSYNLPFSSKDYKI